MSRIAIFITLFFLSGAVHAASSRIEIQKGQFIVKLDDKALRGKELIGTTFVLGADRSQQSILIAEIEEDRTSAAEPLLLYRVKIREAAGKPYSDLCEPDIHGRRVGFPISGQNGAFSFVCSSGAAGKCVLMGYRPWDERAGVPMHDLHRACVRLIRADYGGDDRPTTRNGTQIDVYDRFGIQKPDNPYTMSFEAAWSPDGAVCVAHPRIPENITLAEIARRYPKLQGALGPEACNEATITSDERALIFNRSREYNP